MRAPREQPQAVGGLVDQRLRRGPLPWREAAALGFAAGTVRVAQVKEPILARTTIGPLTGFVEVRYSDGTDTLTVRLDAGDAASGTEHAVSSATLSADAPQTGDGLPTSLTDYADAFVRAWGKGESGAWTYTSDAVELTFGSTNPSGGPRWSRTSSGTTTVTYSNRDGGTLVLTLDLERVGSGSAGAITGASLS